MSKPPSPYAIERAMAIAMRLREQLADAHEGFALSLQSETDVFELLDQIIEQSVSAGDRADKATARAKRLNARKERLRDTAARMLDALDITEPLERVLFTVSLSHVRHVIVTGAVPAEYQNEPTPDRRKIGAALRDGKVVDNTALSNAEPSITVRTR